MINTDQRCRKLVLRVTPAESVQAFQLMVDELWTAYRHSYHHYIRLLLFLSPPLERMIVSSSTSSQNSSTYGLPRSAIIGCMILFPAGIILEQLQCHQLAVFSINLLAIVPTAAIFRQSAKKFAWWLRLWPNQLEYGNLSSGFVDTFFG